MRAIKLAIIIILGFALMMIIAANWTPTTLNLLPSALGISGFSSQQLPLALIIVAAAFVGFVLSMLIEFLKRGETRRRLDQKAKEISRLRQENARLSAKVGDEDEDLHLLAS